MDLPLWISLHSGELGRVLGQGLSIWLFSFVLDWAIIRRFIASHQTAVLISVPILTVAMVSRQAADPGRFGTYGVVAVAVLGLIVLAIRWFTVEKPIDYFEED